MQDNNKPVRKNSQARINANNKYKKANYKRIAVDIRPDQAEKIRDTASRHNLSLAQLIVKAVTEYDTNHQPQQESQHQHQPQHQQEQQEHTETQTAGDTTTTTTNGDTNGDTDGGENDFDWIDNLDDSDTIPPSEMWEKIAKHTEKTNKRLQEERQAERKRINAEWDID